MKHVPLSEVIALLESGSRPKGGVSDSSGEVPSLGAEHLDDAGTFKLEKLKFVPHDFYSQMRSGHVRKNDILVVKDGATTGKTSFVEDSFPYERAAINEHVFRLAIDSHKALPQYVFRFLHSPEGHRQILKDFRGATVGGISRGFTEKVFVPLPPLVEQKRIAGILDQADSLSRLRQQTIDRLNSFGQAIFQEMFVSNPEAAHWPTTTAEKLAQQTRTGPFGSQLLHSEFVDEGIAVLGIDNAVHNEFLWGKPRYISPEKYRDLKRYTVRPGDVLITIMGTCGRCAVVPQNIPVAINTKHLCCITLRQDTILPEYLHSAFLRHPKILKQLGVQAKGAVMPGLNMNIIRELEIVVPPMNIQRAWHERKLRIADQLRGMVEHQARLDALFTSLQHRAFRGEL